MRIIDVSLGLDGDCMTCGTPWHEQVVISQLGYQKKVGRNTSKIVLGSHSGTHIDAPKHFFNDGYGVDKLDLTILCGEISIVDFQNMHQGEYVKLEDIKKVKVEHRMLFRFGWYQYWKTEKYYDAFPYFSMEAAKYLVENGLKLIALDTPSPDNAKCISEKAEEDSPVHKYFLKNDVIIVEYLTNTRCIQSNKTCSIIALPLKIIGCDGAPGRVIIKEE